MEYVYMMVRIPNQEVLQKIISSVVAESLPFSVGSKPEDLVAMAKKQFGFEEDGEAPNGNAAEESTDDKYEGQHAEDLMEEDEEPHDIASTPVLFPVATVQVSSNRELKATDLLFEEELKPPTMDTITMGQIMKHVARSQRVVIEDGGEKRTRAPNNIKRYRKQECKICHKFFMVPFWKTKIQHAAVHSEFQRYACIFCPKRVVHSLTIRTHVSKHHPFVERGGSTGVGYTDLMNDKEQQELEELTKRCFPDVEHGNP